MLEELQRRHDAESTIRRYLRWVEDFARLFGKPTDRLGLEHVRTLKRPEFRKYLPYARTGRGLPVIMSKEEVARIINASGNLFRCTPLMVPYGAGMRRTRFLSDLRTGLCLCWPSGAVLPRPACGRQSCRVASEPSDRVIYFEQRGEGSPRTSSSKDRRLGRARRDKQRVTG